MKLLKGLKIIPRIRRQGYGFKFATMLEYGLAEKEIEGKKEEIERMRAVSSSKAKPVADKSAVNKKDNK